jgi:hypothetical protein
LIESVTCCDAVPEDHDALFGIVCFRAVSDE